MLCPLRLLSILLPLRLPFEAESKFLLRPMCNLLWHPCLQRVVLPPLHALNWKITSSSIISTGEIACDFMSHALPPSQKFINIILDPQIFEDQYCMAVCESFSRGVGMLQRVQTLKEEKKDLEDRLKASQTIVVELQCRVVNAERRLLEKEHVGAMVTEKEKAWDEEQDELMREKEKLVADVNHFKTVASVSTNDVEPCMLTTRSLPLNVIGCFHRILDAFLLLSPNPQTSRTL
ncbi:hypothetical protein HanIR_Chr15g0778931 [Helianthus annuus]|nr:hypothetical protein HanIR_Chr15g0778931 [Helianthus annuus]